MFDSLRKRLLGGDSRTALMKKNILISLFVKIWSGGVVFLLAPITLLCLGQYSNGVWITMSSILVWIDSMDIGLGNGMRNTLAAALARGNRTEARQAVSTTFAMLFLVILPFCLTVLLILSNVDLYSLLNIESSRIPDLFKTVIVAVILVCSTFIFKFIGNVYMGLQLPAVNNILVTGGQTLTLVMTYVAYYTGYTSLTHIAVINTASPLLVWLISYPYTFVYKYNYLAPSLKYFCRSMLRQLFSVGLKFFAVQIASIILFMTTNILISRWFSPEMVTPYNLAYRYFSIILILFTIVSMPFWSATTDAYERNDMDWIKAANHRMTHICIALVALTVFMVMVSGTFYYLWINKWQNSEVDIPLMMTIMTAIYVTVLILSMRYSCMLNGMGLLRLQMITTIIATLIFIPLAWCATRFLYHPEAIVGVMCIANMPGLIINKIQFHKAINGKAVGIWRK